MVFSFNRDKVLEVALESVFPANFYGMCVYHLSQNVKAKYGAHAASFHLQASSSKDDGKAELIHSELEGHTAGAARSLAATDLHSLDKVCLPVSAL